MDWKISRDYFYAELCQKFGEEYIYQAGYFEDSCDYDFNIEESLDITCTPLDHIRKNINKTNPAIILSTGSFNPIHDGHVQMMLKAKECIEDKGYTCIGGFIAPDHDNYIMSKLGDEGLPIHKRIKLINKAIEQYNWLRVDPWSGVFHVTSINFTDVIYRLKLYIKKYLGIEIPIFFVCGGDNAQFAKTFVLKGNCVLITRPEYDQKHYNILREIILKNKEATNWENIFTGILDNDNSSTKVRKNFQYPKDEKDLILRTLGDVKIPSLYDNFINVISKRFNSVKEVRLLNQVIEFEQLAENKKIISLDPFIKGNYNIEISRLYDTFGLNKLGYVNRPKCNSFRFEKTKIAKTEEYHLFDDDICTGATMEYVENLLTKDNIKIKGRLTLVNGINSEVLDLRDFIYKGCKNSGLVIKTPTGKITRVPYIYPFVCPYVRASIQDPMKFSLEIWEANIVYYKKINNFDMVKECEFYYNLLRKFL